MCAQKYSESRFGKWTVGEDGLPWLELDLPQVLPAADSAVHRLSTGSLAATVDVTGRLALVDVSTPEPHPLTCPSAQMASAFYLTLASGDDRRTVLLSNLSPEEKPWMAWGACQARFGGELALAGHRLATTIAFLAPWQGDYLVVTVSLKNLGPQTFRGACLAVANFNPPVAPSSIPQPPPVPFRRRGVVMLTQAGNERPDCFLATAPEWEVGVEDGALVARHATELPADAEVHHLFLVGAHRDCTVRWAEEQLQIAQSTPLTVAWREALSLSAPRFPEAWMKEECTWNVGRLLAARVGLPRRPSVASPASDTASEACLVRTATTVAATSQAGLRNLLRLSLPLAYLNPELAAANLQFATSCLGPHGQLASQAADRFQPDQHCCDLEIWFILAWCHFLHLTGNLVPFRMVNGPGGETVPLARCLEQACQWLETSVGTGAHGLLRCGAGDGLPLLDRLGRHGRGESFTATAQAIYALELWLAIEAQLDNRPSRTTDRIRAWVATLRSAAATAFVNDVFVRGFADDGTPVGTNAPDDRWYLDAQTWGLLAACGTTEQRARSLLALQNSTVLPALPTLSRPYELPLPAGISSQTPLPGVGDNGGVCPFSWACAVWAMTDAGAYDSALAEWQRLAIRPLMAKHGFPPHGHLVDGTLPSSWRRAGFPWTPPLGSAAVGTAGDDLELFAWQHFALCKALTKDG